MLTELCKELNNWFDEASNGEKRRFFGTFVIENAAIDLTGTGIKSGQYFRIVGSDFNDGVHQYPENLTDEIFDGAVWLMAITQEDITLASDIEEWKDKFEAIDSPAMSPYNSESFGGYSYTKVNGSSGAGAENTSTWQVQFRSRLNQWRKIRA